MAPKASSLLLLTLFLVFSSTSTAFNITKLLGEYPDYGTFNDLLSKTSLAGEINSRRTITVLAVDNSSIGSILGKPLDEVKRILSNHVILDYYDVMKLRKLNKKSTVLTTLYQTTGLAQNQTGFLNVTTLSSGVIAFGSAVKNAVLNSKLVGSVASQPYNISVLQVSEPVVAPLLENGSFAAAAAPPPPKVTTPGNAPAPSEESDTPVDAPTEAPSDSPPVASPPADVPTADTPAKPLAADNAPAPQSGSSRMTVGSGVGVAVVMGLVLNFVGF